MLCDTSTAVQCSPMPVAMAQLYILVLGSLQDEFLPVLGSITSVWDADSLA